MQDETPADNQAVIDYFIRHIGLEVTLTAEQQRKYFFLPGFHRHFLESFIISDAPWLDCFDAEALEMALVALCDDTEQLRQSEANELDITLSEDAKQLWRDYQDQRFNINPCMAVSDVAELLFPLLVWHHRKSMFRDEFNALIAAEQIPHHRIGNCVKVCLADLEPIAEQYLDLEWQDCIKVWRGYLDDRNRLFIHKKVDPEYKEASIVPNKPDEEQLEKAQERYDLFIKIRKEHPRLSKDQILIKAGEIDRSSRSSIQRAIKVIEKKNKK